MIFAAGLVGLLAGRGEGEEGQGQAQRQAGRGPGRAPEPVPEQGPDHALGQSHRGRGEPGAAAGGELQRRPGRRFRRAPRERAGRDGPRRPRPIRRPSASRPAAGARPRRTSRVRSFALPRWSRVCHGAERAAQGPRGLLVRLAFQVAEHDRRSVALGQPLDLLEQLGHRLARRLDPARLAADGDRPGSARASPSAGRPRHAPRRDPAGDPVEPARQRRRGGGSSRPGGPGPGTWPGRRRRPRADRPASSGRPTDHRPVPVHQRLEGRLRGLAAPRTDPGVDDRSGRPASRPRTAGRSASSPRAGRFPP